MSKYYLTVVYEVDGAVAARTILDARPWKASSHSNSIHDCDAARLEIESLRERVQELGQLAVARSTQDRAVERDELLQAAINFIQTLTGMTPPPIEVAPPEVFAPFRAFVEKIQEITDRRCAASDEPLRKRCLHQISEPGQAQPVAAQSKFIDAAEWAQCSVEHAQMVLAKPSEWAGYEVRYLYAAPQPAAPAQPVAPYFDVSTTAGGRGYVAWLFSSVLRRYDFHDYINNVLAADFACALAKWLSTAPQPAAQNHPAGTECPSCGAASEVAGFVCVDCYYAEQKTGELSSDYVQGFAHGQAALAPPQPAAPAQAGEYPELPEAMFAKDVASFDPVYLPDDMHAYADATCAARGAAQAAPADLLRVVDRILCDAYTTGMNGNDFDMLDAKAKVAAIFSGAQAAPVDAAVQPGVLTVAARYFDWLQEHGRGTSFSTFVDEFGYQEKDCKRVYEVVVLPCIYAARAAQGGA